jgi:hypothetical protein
LSLKLGRIHPMQTVVQKRAIVKVVAGFLLVATACLGLCASDKPQHTGTKVAGYATAVAPNVITVFDKKGQELKILTDTDYTSLVGLGAEVTVWYKNEGGAYHLEDIEYPNEGLFLPAGQIRSNIKRVIILAKSGDIENAEGLFSAIAKYLQDNAGWSVAPPDLAIEIANREKTPTSPLDAVDPKTGQVDMHRFLEAQSSLFTKIAE